MYKIYKGLKGACNQLHRAYIAVLGVNSVFGIEYSYYQKLGHKNNNISVLYILNIDKAKIRLSNGKKLTIGYDVLTNDNSSD